MKKRQKKLPNGMTPEEWKKTVKLIRQVTQTIRESIKTTNDISIAQYALCAVLATTEKITWQYKLSKAKTKEQSRETFYQAIVGTLKSMERVES